MSHIEPSSASVTKALDSTVKVCVREPVTVSPSEPASGLTYKMVGNDIGAVIVVEEGKPVGIITERDVLERVMMANKDVYVTEAKDVMSKPVISIEADHSIKEALQLMQKHQIRRLAATEKGTLIGIVTERRLLREFLEQLV